jgi:hypothetical protein
MTVQEELLCAMVQDNWQRIFGGRTWEQIDTDGDGVLDPSMYHTFSVCAFIS